MNNNDFFQNMNMESNIKGDYNVINNDMEVDVNMTNANHSMMNFPTTNEGVQERVINRTFVHEVPQDCSFMIEK